MQLDGQFANERFTGEGGCNRCGNYECICGDAAFEAFVEEELASQQNDLPSEAPAEERQAIAPSSAPLPSYSELRDREDFEEDGEGYDRFYRVGY